jgi:hypothetical protein
VPRKTPLSAQEIDIGRRLRDARIASGFTGVELARRVGIGANRLSSYENGQNPVPYWIGDKVAMETDHCQRWLMEGSAPKTPYVEVDPALLTAVPRRSLFSEVYAALLRKQLDDFLRSVAKVSKRRIEELEGQDFVGWPALYAPRIVQVQAAFMVEIRHAQLLARAMDGDQLTDFKARISKVVEDFVRLVSKAKGRSLPSVIEEDRDRESMTAFLRERWALFEKRRQKALDKAS